MGSQDEIRRLMKEAKQKPSGAAASSAKTSSVKPKPPAKPSRSAAAASKPQPAIPAGSKPQPAIPAGFFDDSLADAKARNVDVQQLADKQLESDWEAFQEFAAEVEQQSAKEEQQQVEDAKEREAVEQLDNMQYVDRYRVALERATSLRNREKKKKKEFNKVEKRKLQEDADGDNSVGNHDAAEGAGAVETAVSEYKKKHKKAKRQQHSDSEDSDDIDPCNWRSRAI